MCGNCKHHKNGGNEWYCDNPDSENYGLETDYKDDCIDCEAKDD